MTTKRHQLRQRIASGIWLSMTADPENAGLPAKVLRDKISASVKEATKGLPGDPHAWLRKMRRVMRAERRRLYPEPQLNARGGSLRQRRRFRSEAMRRDIRSR